MTQDDIRQRLRTIAEKLHGSKGELDVEDLRMAVLVLLHILENVDIGEKELIPEIKRDLRALSQTTNDSFTYGPPGSFHGPHSDAVNRTVGCACKKCRQSYPWRRG